MAHIAGVEMKTGKGKTGVEFHFYTDKEYKRLTEDQKLELRKYRYTQSKGSNNMKFERTNKNGKRSFKEGHKARSNSNYNNKRRETSNDKRIKFKKLKGAISETVVKVIRQDSKAEPNEYIVSLVNAAKAKTKQQPQTQSQAQVSSIQTQANTSKTTSSLLRNTILKGTRNKSTISACIMKRVSFQPYEEINDDENSGFRDIPEVEVASLNTFADQTRTELDSHANMPVFGKHCYIENRNEVLRSNRPGLPGCRYATVQGYSPDMEAQDLPIVDVSVAFRCPLDGTIKILHFPDSLYCEALTHNLIPPFILREAGFIVNDVPRIHCNPVTNESRFIVSEDRSLRIPLQLHGVFSYFETFRPDMSPTGWTWDPNSSIYRNAESLHLDINGTLIPIEKSNQIQG